jgi:hypothetical protein
MNNLDKYDNISERLPDDATTTQRLKKFAKIVDVLHNHGISLVEIHNGCPVLSDNTGWKLTHNIITWEVFRVEDVVDMILHSRENRIVSSNH